MAELAQSASWSVKEDLFSFKYKFTKWDYLRFFIATFTIFPIRVFLMLTAVIQAYFVCLVIYFVSDNHPFSGISKNFLVPFVDICGDLLIFALGFSIKVNGKLVSREEAPIVLIGPHSSFIDGLAITRLKRLSIVSKRVRPFTIPGAIMQVCKPVFVNRDDKNSKNNATHYINQRIESKEDWPQLAIFPEGMVSNNTALLMFRKGAFNPGVPVQCIVINYLNNCDTFSWCYGGPSPLVLLWMTMCNLRNNMELNIFPPYVPSKEEAANPSLYAHNVRDFMASKANKLKNNLSYEYYNITYRAMTKKIPYFAFISDYVMLWKFYCGKYETESAEGKFHFGNLQILLGNTGTRNLDEVELYRELKKTNVSTYEALNFFLKDNSDFVDFRRLLIHLAMLFYPGPIKDRIAASSSLLMKLCSDIDVGLTRDHLKYYLQEIYDDSNVTDNFINKHDEKKSHKIEEISVLLNANNANQIHQSYQYFLASQPTIDIMHPEFIEK